MNVSTGISDKSFNCIYVVYIQVCLYMYLHITAVLLRWLVNTSSDQV